MARTGVLHVESAHPSVVVSNEDTKDKEVALDVKVKANNGKSMNCLFAESWLVDGALYCTEEYEVSFEGEDMTARSI